MSRLYYRGGPSAYRKRVISSQRELCVSVPAWRGNEGSLKRRARASQEQAKPVFWWRSVARRGRLGKVVQEIRTPTSPSYVTSGCAPTGDPALRNSGLWPMVARNGPNAMHNSGQSSGPARLGPGAPEEGLQRVALEMDDAASSSNESIFARSQGEDSRSRTAWDVQGSRRSHLRSGSHLR